jgi:predicted ester cyclase
MPATALQDESRAVVRRFFTELWNKGDLSVADELIDVDAVNHDPAGPRLGMGPEATKRLVKIYRSAFPDLMLQTEQVIAEKGMVAIHWVSSGTHRGEFLGAAPTGKRVRLTESAFYRLTAAKSLRSSLIGTRSV